MVRFRPIADIREPVQNHSMSASKTIGSAVFITGLIIWAYILLSDAPRLAIAIANGSYSNPCCGTLVLADGAMEFADQRVSYVIEEDKAGPYVLPQGYVGATSNGIELRPEAYPLKLRIHLASPKQVILSGDGQTYSFTARNNG